MALFVTAHSDGWTLSWAAVRGVSKIPRFHAPSHFSEDRRRHRQTPEVT